MIKTEKGQILCPRCGNKTHKFGSYPTVFGGRKQRFRCTSCGHISSMKFEEVV